SVLQQENVTRIARRLVDVETGTILFKATGAVGIRGHDAEGSAEDPLGLKTPGKADPRLKVVQVALTDDALRMSDRALEPGDWVDCVGIELRLLVVLGLVWR